MGSKQIENAQPGSELVNVYDAVRYCTVKTLRGEGSARAQGRIRNNFNLTGSPVSGEPDAGLGPGPDYYV